MTARGRRIWGVLGGLGPIASAEFVRTIYAGRSGPEQAMPAVILYSDPSFPDRSDCYRRGETRVLVERLEAAIDVLLRSGATDIAICCMTIHAVLPLMDPRLRGRIHSLVHLLLELVAMRGGVHLLLATDGARRMQLFERHPSWPLAAGHLRLPDADDQAQVHRLIYSIKDQSFTPDRLEQLDDMRRRYGAESLVAGCTEWHVVHRQHRASGLEWIDPLDVLARRIGESTVGRVASALP
jgi:aspartate racemase